jgi:hypothetical protein
MPRRHGSSTATVSPLLSFVDSIVLRRGDSCTSPPRHYLVWTSEHLPNIPTPKLSMQYVNTEQTRKPISKSFGAESPSRSLLTQHELKTWISEEAGPAASIDALMAVAAYFKLDKEAAVEILAEVERTVSNWRVRGRELGMNAAELEQFAGAFEHRERQVVQSVVRERRG